MVEPQRSINEHIFVGAKPIGQAEANCRKPQPAAEHDQGREDRNSQFTINLWQEIFLILQPILRRPDFFPTGISVESPLPISPKDPTASLCNVPRRFPATSLLTTEQ